MTAHPLSTPGPARPVVLIAEELAPSVLAVLGDEVEVRHVDGADRAALLPALADAAAVLVRSATRIDAEALAAAPRLQVVARAGIGLDNVDVPAATARGVMVVNAPTSNVVSAAEQAVALLLACARNLAPANAALKSRALGAQPLDRRRGGRQGRRRRRPRTHRRAVRPAHVGVRHLADRLRPLRLAGRAAQIGVRLVGLDELLRESDFISIHLPKTPETVGLIGREQLALCKPTVRIVNAARGGLLDEDALAEALAAGTVAGAGLDVFATEPCTDSPLFAFDQVVVAPHLGASTVEAQDKAGVAVARSVRLALAGRVRPRRRQRAGRRRRRRGPAPGAAARREARPGLHGAGRRRGGEPRGARARARSPSSTSRCCSSPRSRASSARSSRSR